LLSLLEKEQKQQINKDNNNQAIKGYELKNYSNGNTKNKEIKELLAKI